MNEAEERARWQRITALHGAGRLAEAEAGYRAILAADSDHAEALHMLGMLLHQRGEDGEALRLLERALDLGKRLPALLSNTAKVYIDRNEGARALELLGDALQQDPHHFGSLINQALALRLEGEPEGALRSAARAARAEPGSPAATALRASLLDELGRPAEAISLLRHSGLRPADVADSGQSFEIARMFQASGAWVDALEWLDEVLSREPRHAGALLERGVAAGQLGDCDAALASYRQLLEVRPDFQEAHSNLLIQMQYDDRVSAQAITAAHLQWVDRHGWAQPRAAADFPNDRSELRPLRVGWISPRFDAALVAAFLPATLQAMLREAVRFTFYNTRRQAGEAPASLSGLGEWRMVEGLSDGALAALIESDAIDILVDLAGHNPGNRLIALSRRLAPLQMCWLDYYCTTGLAAMDYWLTDEFLSPAGSEASFSERLIRLPTPRLCYSPPARAPAPRRSERPCGEIVFGSFNRLGKLSDRVLDLWADILHDIEGARLLLKTPEFRDRRTRELARSRLLARGIGDDRFELRPPSPYVDLLVQYADIDIALDPFSFTGCATTCDALWMGVPVITLPGETAVSRQGLAILQAIGRPEWIARDRSDYRRLAVELASQIGREGFDRMALHCSVADSPLCDSAAQAAGLTHAFRRAWADLPTR